MHTQEPAETLLGLPRWNKVRTTKIFAPRLSATTILRQRLIDRLNLYRQYAVTLVLAPAGFGKTTLLVQWREQAGIPTAWLTLDGHERTAAQFAASIANALKEAMPAFHEKWEKIACSLEEDEQAAASAGMQALIDAAGSIPFDFALVLDDYHNVESYEVHAFLSRLIDHLPRSMHLLIGSRTIPRLPIPRLRAQGLLREIHAQQLKFQPEETRLFLNGAMGLHLTSDQLEQLEDRTEGWVAGLHLAALSLQEAGDVNALVNSFSGADPYVLGYLVDEVLQRLPDDVLEFLLKTSILDRMCGELCDYVTECNNGEEMLGSLIEMNLFISSLDDRREWYRYHRLFADLLRLRLGQRYGEEEVRRLNQRAAAWYLKHSCIELAVEHALAAQDCEGVRKIVEPAGLPMVLEFKSIRSWLIALPEEELSKYPKLAAWVGWALMMIGKYREASNLAEKASKFVNAESEAHIATLRSRICAIGGDGHASLTYALAAVDGVPLADHAHCAAAYFALSMAYLAVGLPKQAEETFVETRRQVGYMKSLSNTMRLVSATYRARALLLQGRLNDTAAVLDEAGDLATEFAMPRTSYGGYIRGELLMHRARFDAARDALLESLNIGRQRNWRLYAPGTHVLLTAVYCLLDDVDNALASLGELRKWSVDNGNTRLLLDAEAAYMHYLLRQGKLAEVSVWTDRIGISDADTDIPYERECEYEVCGRLSITHGLLHQDRALIDSGLGLLERIKNAAVASSRMLDAASIDAVRAAVLFEVGSASWAEPLESALRIAVDEGAWLPIVAGGEKMRLLLEKAESDDRLAELVRPAREFLGQAQAHKVDMPSVDHVCEPLSDRERDVLNLLASGLSTREIADSLFVSTNTVKTHTRHIYEKLGAHNRTHAIALARDMGILD